MKSKVTIFIVIAIVLILLWYWYSRRSAVVPVVDNISESKLFPLKKGSRGVEVEKLQKFLYRNIGGDINKVLGPKGVDGVFGDFTEAATMKVFSTNEVSEDLYKSKVK